MEPSLRSLFTKPIYKHNRCVYYRNVVIDFVYKVLMLNLVSDQLYKPTNVWSNVKRPMFQYDRCSNVGCSNPISSNVINQCEFPIGKSNLWEISMQWTNEYQADGLGVWPMVNQWWNEVWIFVLAYIRANESIRCSHPGTKYGDIQRSTCPEVSGNIRGNVIIFIFTMIVRPKQLVWLQNRHFCLQSI